MPVTTEKLAVEGAYVVSFPRYSDDRGYLQELFNQDKYPKEVAQYYPIKQVTCSSSRSHVIRGLHVSPYAKLLTCVKGQVYDVVVDCRPESPTYLKWSAVVLTDENCKQVLVPPNCGHGFYAMTEGATVIYGQSDTFKAGIDGGFNPFDPSVNVHWPITPGASALLSPKDEAAENLRVEKVTINPKRKRVLVIGASGQVGGAVCDVFKKYEAEYQVYGTTQTTDINNYIHFDMEKAGRDESYVRDVFTMFYPDVIVVCAAYNYVDQCETDQDTGKAINVDALVVMGKVSVEIGAKVVHYSTDYIYTDSTPTADKKIVITEETPTEPANTYGKLKLGGEVAIAALPGSIVIRVSRVFGPELHGKNFVYRTISCLTEKKPLYCLHSEISCASYNRDIANATVELIRKGSSGIYNCVGPEPLSKYDWAMLIAKYFNLDTETVVGLEKLDKGAPRPKYVPLSTEKLRKELPDLKLHTLHEAFQDWQKNPSGKPISWTNNNV